MRPLSIPVKLGDKTLNLKYPRFKTPRTVVCLKGCALAPNTVTSKLVKKLGKSRQLFKLVLRGFKLGG